MIERGAPRRRFGDGSSFLRAVQPRVDRFFSARGDTAWLWLLWQSVPGAERPTLLEMHLTATGEPMTAEEHLATTETHLRYPEGHLIPTEVQLADAEVHLKRLGDTTPCRDATGLSGNVVSGCGSRSKACRGAADSCKFPACREESADRTESTARKEF
jgi:hypothetical protein